MIQLDFVAVAKINLTPYIGG